MPANIKLGITVTAEPLQQPFEEIAKQIPKGVENRILSPQPPKKLPNRENRTLFNSPVISALTEKETSLCFRFADGRLDYASFIGKDGSFLK